MAGLLLAPIAGAAAVGVLVVEFAAAAARIYNGDMSVRGIGITPPDPATGKDPAYRSYFFGPVLRDFRLVLNETTQLAWTRLRLWFSWITQILLPRNTSVWWRLADYPPALGTMMGLIGGGVLGVLLMASVAAVFTTVLGVTVPVLPTTSLSAEVALATSTR